MAECAGAQQHPSAPAAGKELSMGAKMHVEIARESLKDFCRRHHIRKLSVFGSVLREDFGEDSDVDVLVEFEPGERVGLIRFAGIERELSDLLRRKVGLNTPGFLSRHFRQEVITEAEPLYVAS